MTRSLLTHRNPAGAALLVGMGLFLVPLGLWAQVCSYGNGGGSSSGSGGATLVSITVDGNPADWGPVLANANQVTVDGEMCVAGTADRDCALPSGGRDLDTFAWTWDASNVYLYMKRYGSVANQQTFYFFMDTNANQRMNTGEKVLAVDYKGSNRNTSATLYTYTAAGGAAGDAMADPVTGYADGYAIAGGTLSGGIVIYSGIIGGFDDGSGFEAYVPWSNMSVPAGTPIYFHVSSSNGSSGSLIDNLGGPNGKIGAFAFRNVSVTPDSSSAVTPGNPTVVEFTKTVTNTGTLADRYELTAFSTLGFRVDLLDGLTVIATDISGDGDFTDSGDYVDPTYDNSAGTPSVADGRPNTPELAAGASFPVTMRVTAPLGVENVQDVTTLSAFSQGSPGLCASARSTLAIGYLTLTPTPQVKSVAAGQTVDYGLTLSNYSLSDTFDFRVISSQGWRIDLYSGATLVATDLTGNGSWDSITGGYDTNSNGRPDLGVMNNGITVPYTVRLTAPGGATAGIVDTCTVLAQGASTGSSASATLTTTVRLRLTFTPNYTVASGTNLYSGQGKSVFYSHTLINSWPTLDTVALSSTSSPAGWTIRYFTDPNGDGNPADGIQITAPFVLAANGGTLYLVVEVVIPSGLTLPLAHTATVTATGTSGATATVADEVRVSYVATYFDPNRTIAWRVFTRCQTIYLLGSSLVANANYRFRLVDANSIQVRNQTVTSDGNGEARDQYTVASTDPAGTWTLQLYNSSNTLVDSMSVFVDPPPANPSSVNPIATGQASYAVTGDNLSITATFNNTSTGVDYTATTYRYLVRDPGLTQYLGSDGVFAVYTGSELTRSTFPHTMLAGFSDTETVTVNTVEFPSEGVYRIDVTWIGSCSNTIATATLYFPVGTTLASYADNGTTAPKELFGIGSTVYLSGAHYLASTGYQVVYYSPSGAMALNHAATSTGAGALGDSATAGMLAVSGLWHAVVYATSTTPPATYNPSDLLALSQDDFILDLAAPAAPVVTTPANGSSTTDTTPTITGTAEANSTVTVTINGISHTTAADGSGNWSYTPSSPLPYGANSVYATATDAAGNSSSTSTTNNFSVVHEAPVVNSPIMAGASSIGGTSSSSAGSTITVYSNGVPIGTTTVQENGTWTLGGVSGLAGGESITATAGTGVALSALSAAVIVTPAPPVITSVLVVGSTVVAGTSTAPPGSTITVNVNGTPTTTTVQGDGTWIVIVPALEIGDSIAVTATANGAMSAAAGPVVISGIPNLLRNDIVASLATYNPALIFTKYPGDPSLDGFGLNAIAQTGEGALRQGNGSSDDDDFYYYEVPSGYIDSDPTVLTDANRPLVFYQLSCSGGCTLYLAKEAGSIKVTYVLP